MFALTVLIACGAGSEPALVEAPLARTGPVLRFTDLKLIAEARADDGQPGPPAPLTITAPSTRWDLAAGRAVFSGGVEAVRGSLTLSCDQLTVRYSDAGQVETAAALGSVIVVRGAWTARSGAADLEMGEGLVRLTEAPVITDGSQSLSGGEIRLKLDSEEVECDRCRLVVDGDRLEGGW